jgi:hypothetical protein
MPDVKFGAIGLNNVIYTAQNTVVANTTQQNGSVILTVRVKHIILDENDPEFKNYGEWNGIGTIFWEPIDRPQEGYDNLLFAVPFFPNIKNYPLLNELVYLLQLPTTNISTNITDNNFYYFPPLNVWNSQHHNAIPDNPEASNQSDDYDSAFQGEVRRPEDNSSDINLGITFQEKLKINPLLPYEGDIIYEGRWGNSVRLGSTVKNAYTENSWSSVGENGDPITIIRNGQTDYDSDPWVPQTEDINRDLSDIWLTSTQQIPITPSSNLIESYADKSTPPDGPSVYNKNQIVLNSGRLLFNAKDDAIILGAKKSIHLTADDSINIDGMNYIALTSNKVYLGSSQGSEKVELQSAVLGENLHDILTRIYTDLSTLSSQFKGAVDSLVGPIAVLQGPSSILLDDLSKYIKEQVDNDYILSENVRVSKRK